MILVSMKIVANYIVNSAQWFASIFSVYPNKNKIIRVNINSLVQDCIKSSAFAMDLLQTSTNIQI